MEKEIIHEEGTFEEQDVVIELPDGQTVELTVDEPVLEDSVADAQDIVQDQESFVQQEQADDDHSVIELGHGVGQVMMGQVRSDMVVSEHMLDSDAPAYTEEDEIFGSGWRKRVVVITGASEGIGLATARRFSLYADVVYNLGLFKQEDDTINFIKTDVTKPNEIKAAFEKIFAKEGQIDVLINNAGQGFSGTAEGAASEDIAHIFDVNCMGTFNACAMVVPYMRERGRGRIINVASLAALFPLPFQSYYSASKAAIYNFTQALYTEVKPLKIKVTSVMFNEIKTDFTEHKIRNAHDDKAYKYRLAKSIAKYEYTEQEGRDPDWVAKKLFRLSNQKNPKPLVIFGCKNKMRAFAHRFLSVKQKNKLIARKY